MDPCYGPTQADWSARQTAATGSLRPRLDAVRPRVGAVLDRAAAVAYGGPPCPVAPPVLPAGLRGARRR